MMRVQDWFYVVSILFMTSLFDCSREKNPIESSDPDVPGKHFVRIQNYTEMMWVGTHSDSLGSFIQSIVGSKQKKWIGGGVVPDSSMEYGFYFDPNTIVIASITVEGMQTTIKQIAKDPSYYAAHGWSNGLTDHAWYVSASFLEYRTVE